MHYLNNNFNWFKGLVPTSVEITGEATFTIQAVAVDSCTYGKDMFPQATWGLKVTDDSTEPASVYHLWLTEDGRKVDGAQSRMEARIVRTILRHLVTHRWRVYWHTTRTCNRAYSRDYDTLDEAVKKARQVAGNPWSNSIHILEEMTWETPEPRPNGTHHYCVLDGPIPW